MLAARTVFPVLALATLIAAFFLVPIAGFRFRSLPPGVVLLLRILAALPLFVSGTVHLLHPGAFVDLLPPPSPKSAWLIVVTGFPELLGAVGLFLAPLRRAASLCLALFMVAIFPANVYVAGQTVHGLPMPGVLVRGLMQAAYILLILVAGWGVPAGRQAKAPGPEHSKARLTDV